MLCAGCAACAETPGWTNLAGNVLFAAPVELKGKTVIFQRSGRGKPFPVALSSFPEAEQVRLKDALGVTELPSALKEAYAFSRRSIRRSRLLYENGHVSREDFEKIIRKNQDAFRCSAAPLVEQKKMTQSQLERLLAELPKEEI